MPAYCFLAAFMLLSCCFCCLQAAAFRFYCCSLGRRTLLSASGGWRAPPSGVLLPVFSLKWYAVTCRSGSLVSDGLDGQSSPSVVRPRSSDTSSFYVTFEMA